MNVLRATGLAVPAIGALASGALALAGLYEVAAGALCGAAIASASWVGLHVIGRRLVGEGGGNRPLMAVLMGFKLVAIAALVLVSVTILELSGVGVAVGLSAMPCGILLTVAILGTGGRGSNEGDTAAEVKGDA
ncbi:MAG: hypothetical protein JRG91_05690 [Deltaproteobacteria bacterium]|nr:hypothetical protein [Deltaproteobacteria bacterium]